MKAFFEIMMADYRSEGFSRAEWVKYGIIEKKKKNKTKILVY